MPRLPYTPVMVQVLTLDFQDIDKAVKFFKSEKSDDLIEAIEKQFGASGLFFIDGGNTILWILTINERDAEKARKYVMRWNAKKGSPIMSVAHPRMQLFDQDMEIVEKSR